jgi:hypothetical protein
MLERTSVTPHVRPCLSAWASAVAILGGWSFGVTPFAYAATLSGTAGVDLTTFDGRATRSALGWGTLAGASGHLLAGALRYDDEVVAAGSGLFAGAGLAVGDRARVQGLALVVVADDGARGVRIQAGPAWQTTRGGSLALAGTYERGDAGDPAVGGSLEITEPLGPRWRARGIASLGSAPSGHALGTTLGAAYLPWPALELSADAGFSRGPRSASPSPTPRGPLDELLDPRASATTDDRAGFTASIGVRVHVP